MPTIETRIAPDGAKSYRAKIRLKGAPQISVSFDRITDAKKWAQDTESARRVSVDYPLFVALASASKAVPHRTEARSDTGVDLKAVAAGGTWQQALTDEPVVVQGAPDAPVIRVGDALRSFPVRVLLQPSGPP